jgi:hypothetical protein
METPGFLDGIMDSDLKLCEEVLSKLIRNLIILPQNLVQVRLNSSVESNFHDGEAQPRARRK